MNYHLFIRTSNQPSELDALHLINCNAVAKYWKHRRLFYALKDAILEAFGIRDGYDKQKWEEKDWNCSCPHECGCVHSEHIHILQRFVFFGSVFHRPTNEFYYFNFQWQNDKHSDNYFALSGLCKNIIEGKKNFKHDKESRALAWRSLKYLVKKYGHLLREDRKAA